MTGAADTAGSAATGDAAGRGKLASEGLDRKLARGMFVVGAFAVVTSAARLAQDAAIAWRHGTGPAVDAYYFLWNLANWPVVVALSALTLLVIPLETGLQRGTDTAELRRFRSELLAGLLVVAALSLPLGWWILAFVVEGPLGGLEAATAAMAAAGVPGMVSVVPLGLIGSLLAAWLIAAGRHELTLMEALAPLMLCAVVLWLPGLGLFWAAAAGVALQVGVMAATLARAGDLPVPRLALTSIAWRGIAGGALMLLAAQVVSALLPLVDGFFAARLPEGTLATLNFANRMVLGVQGLAALALQRVGLPLFSRLVASSPAQVLPAALRLAALMGMGALVIGGAVALLADPLVSLLFERGRFSAGDREQVATLLRWGMVQLVPFLSGLAIVTTLASSNAPGWLALAASAGLAVKITASALLFTTYGAAGLQVATALMYVVASLVAWIGLRHRLRNAVA